ncbi:MAG: hypothetical protein ACYC56_12670 [Candidatus Aquicultor sp.]
MQREQREANRYPALLTYRVLLQVLAAIIIIVGVVSAIAYPFTVSAGFLTDLVAIVGILLGAAIPALFLLAVADLILVAADIEYNTFQASQQVKAAPTMPPEERRAA